jgi:Putative prokaryotic signal transducing protein
MEENKLVHVYTVMGPLQGEMIRAFLESKGITVMISEESAGRAYGIQVGAMGEAQVYVPETQAEEAKEILAAMERGEYILPDDAQGDDQPGDEDKEA